MEDHIGYILVILFQNNSRKELLCMCTFLRDCVSKKRLTDIGVVEVRGTVSAVIPSLRLTVLGSCNPDKVLEPVLRTFSCTLNPTSQELTDKVRVTVVVLWKY
jgi:hypothetical protein